MFFPQIFSCLAPSLLLGLYSNVTSSKTCPGDQIKHSTPHTPYSAACFFTTLAITTLCYVYLLTAPLPSLTGAYAQGPEKHPAHGRSTEVLCNG